MMEGVHWGAYVFASICVMLLYLAIGQVIDRLKEMNTLLRIIADRMPATPRAHFFDPPSPSADEPFPGGPA